MTFVMNHTNEMGVDIILTTQPNELYQGSLYHILRCLSEKGRFIEMGSLNFLKNLPMDLSKNYTFNSVLAETLFKAAPEFKKEINFLIKNGMVYLYHFLYRF